MRIVDSIGIWNLDYGLCGIDMDMDMDMDSCRPIPKELHIINSLTLLESMRWLIHASFFFIFFFFHIRVSRFHLHFGRS